MTAVETKECVTVCLPCLRISVEKGIRQALKPWEANFHKGYQSRSDVALQELYNQTVENYTDAVMEAFKEDLSE